MVAGLSQGITVVLGLWLIGLSVFMLALPRQALAALAAMGGSKKVHFGELGLRTVAGIALVIAASLSKHPVAISVIGWFLAASAAVLMILPRRWHHAYSTYWARRIPVAAVRLLAPASALAGGALIWSVV